MKFFINNMFIGLFAAANFITESNAQFEIDSLSMNDYSIIDNFEFDSVEYNMLPDPVFKEDDLLNFTEEYQKQKDSDREQKESGEDHNNIGNKRIIRNDITVRHYLNRQMIRDQFYFERMYRMRQIEYRRRMNLFNSQMNFIKFDYRSFKPRR